MIKKTLLVLLLVSTLFASPFEINKKYRIFVLPDQFGIKHSIDRHTHTFIVSFEKDTGADVNKFLASKSSDYLAKHEAVFIANISKMPSLITKYFAMPKLKKYKHQVLLVNDEADHRFKAKDGKITIYKTKKGVVTEIFYINSAKELNKILVK